ncbi:hypothetical protein WJX72_001178 [[Myrmecia] bisecta]|uniref:Uncharacterized protein n=1 Tax=[Myrmecia] bisecta TaxID=41462 RepID=A0AAW1Q6H4_9CHLO
MAKVDLKVVLLGSQSVGKSCLVDRYINGLFEGTPRNTIGAAFAAKKIQVSSGRVITLGVWDTAGAERFESLSRMYYNGARAAIVCFDATNLASFNKLKFWVNEVQQSQPGCMVYIAITKCDLLDEIPTAAFQEESPHADETAMDGSANGNGNSSGPQTLSRQNSASSIASSSNILRREVGDEDVAEFAGAAHAKVFATSAKAGRGIDLLFRTIAEDLSFAMEHEPPPSPAPHAFPPVRIMTHTASPGFGGSSGLAPVGRRASGCC